MKTTITSIDKLRNIVGWANYQSEGFNQKIKSIKDLVYIYDFCDKYGIEFADNLIVEDPILYDKLVKKLGYKI